MGARSGPLETLRSARILPLVVLDDAAAARPLGDALLAGGLPVLEVAFRTPAAVAALRALAAEPALCVGAGTVFTPEQVDRAADAGAAFVVTPGLSPAVLDRCAELSLPVFPGVATASEVLTALDHGIDVVKLFPAEVLGGVALVSALAGPFPDVRFVPTGGITAATAADYLAHPSVLAVGGTWMVPAGLVRDGDWKRVTRLARDASAAARPAA